MIRVDVSEIKARRDCARKWAFSSRNKFHLKPKSEPVNLSFGSTFHEALAALYLCKGVPEKEDEVINKYVEGLEDMDQQRMLMCMLTGYVDQILPADLERYRVLDVEYHFKMQPWKNMPAVRAHFGSWLNEFEICGSIDLVLLDVEVGAIVGFEHKTCKNFRTPFYNSMDEQPRTYYIALNEYVKEYNERNKTSYTNGGIYVNEVRKLKTRFEHNRIPPIMYSDKECEKFLISFLRTSDQIRKAAVHGEGFGTLPAPEPGYMKCLLCDFRDACQHYGYQNPTRDEVLGEFSEEIEVREFDHLDEKVQRSGETEDAVPDRGD